MDRYSHQTSLDRSWFAIVLLPPPSHRRSLSNTTPSANLSIPASEPSGFISCLLAERALLSHNLLEHAPADASH